MIDKPQGIPLLVKIFIAILTVAILGWTTGGSGATGATAYFMSPNGSDGNDGTQDHPWKTLAYALGKLAPGDALFLRGGIYYEHGITSGLQGAVLAPITIQSYPGERAVIDGGVPYFKDVPNSQWELVDGRIHLYRSKRTFSEGFVGAWLLDSDDQLVQYERADSIEATNYQVNGQAGVYIGPGVQMRDGRIYIRLEQNPNDLIDQNGNWIPPVPADPNPNNNRIAVYTSHKLITLNGASYLEFKNLDLVHSYEILELSDGTHHIELDGLYLKHGEYGLKVSDGRDSEIHHSEFNNGMSDWVYWTDVKNGPEDNSPAYPEFESWAIRGNLRGFSIHHNLIQKTMDGIRINPDSQDTTITDNIIRNTRDDAITFTPNASNIEFARNMIRHCRAGISILGDEGNTQGDVYIHHNVIDVSRYHHFGRAGNYRDDRYKVWSPGRPFDTHGTHYRDGHWKIYNNTIVARQNPGDPGQAAGPDGITGNPRKYVYNNIFFAIDDRIIFADDRVALGSHYDGNVVWQRGSDGNPLFENFGDGGTYASLAEFTAKSSTDWESHGLEVDPGFSVAAIDSLSYDPAYMWGIYRPTNSQMFTVGVPYCGLDWPGIEDVNYRGAIPPTSPSSPLYPLKIFMPLILRSLLSLC